MSDLFDKISTLINAQFNDLLGRNPRSPLARIKLNAEDAEKNPHVSAQRLRQRLEEAMDYEDELGGRIDERIREVVELDKLVDELLETGDQNSAQRLQVQLNMKRQHLTIAESELQEHRLLTRHLLQELSALDAALDIEKRRQRSPAPSPKGKTRIPIDGAATPARQTGNAKRTFLDAVSDKFDETRANLENLLDSAPAPQRPIGSSGIQRFEIVDEEPDPRQPKARKTDEPDMNARLSRLSKPSEDE